MSATVGMTVWTTAMKIYVVSCEKHITLLLSYTKIRWYIKVDVTDNAHLTACLYYITNSLYLIIIFVNII